jgi:hypothetical protein
LKLTGLAFRVTESLRRIGAVEIQTMIRYILKFCLCPPEELSGPAEKTWQTKHDAALKTLAEKMTSVGCEVDVTPPRTAAFLKWLQQARKDGVAWR